MISATGQRKQACRQGIIPEPRQSNSSARKETVDIDILITTSRSTNSDRKIMQPIRMWANLPMRMRKWNPEFRYSEMKDIASASHTEYTQQVLLELPEKIQTGGWGQTFLKKPWNFEVYLLEIPDQNKTNLHHWKFLVTPLGNSKVKNQNSWKLHIIFSWSLLLKIPLLFQLTPGNSICYFFDRVPRPENSL